MADDTIGSETDEPNPEPPELTAQELTDDAVRLDLAMWQTISGSDQVPEFLLYLERFPEGEFAALAREGKPPYHRPQSPQRPPYHPTPRLSLPFGTALRIATIRRYMRSTYKNIQRASSFCSPKQNCRSYPRILCSTGRPASFLPFHAT